MTREVRFAAGSDKSKKRVVMLQRKNTVVAALLYVAGLSVCASGDVIPASAYIQNGLVAQWDGIDNAGTGVHLDTPSVW